MPVIPATWKAKIGRILVQGCLGQKVQEIPISINKSVVVMLGFTGMCLWARFLIDFEEEFSDINLNIV
jgi:hypothetical protein